MAQYYIEIYVFGAGVQIDNNNGGPLVASDGTSNAPNNDWGSLQSGGESRGPLANARFLVQPGATKVGIWITDDDVNLSDGSVENTEATSQGQPHDQVLLYDVVIPGFGTFLAGQRVELEYGFDVTNQTGAPDADATPDFYAIRLGGNGLSETGDTGTNVGIMGTTTDTIIPGITYVVETSRTVGTFDGVGITFESAMCFAYGTMIETPDGARLIDDLQAGDLVTTLDHGSQVLRWVGAREISPALLALRPELRPIRFEIGAIGNTRPLLVSPQHRMLLNDWRAQVYFGEDQILIAAKALVNGTTIRQVIPPEGVTYCHLLFDRHEILVAEGALSESFHPGDMALSNLTGDQLREVEALFPDLATGASVVTAYPVARPQDARALQHLN